MPLEENLLDKLGAKGKDLVVLFQDEGLTAQSGQMNVVTAFLGPVP